MNTDNTNTVAVIGLGYVGLPLAIEFCKRRRTIGFDIDESRVAHLIQCQDRNREVSADELQMAKRAGLRLTSAAHHLKEADVFVITVPTPVTSDNLPDFEPLLSASRLVGLSMKAGAVVIYESTVFPGATEEICVPVLEAASGMKYNVDFFCGYSPERINPGDKVNTLTKIKKITSGSTPEVAAFVDDLYGEIITAGTHKASSIRVAEAAKVIENAQRDVNIAFMNELSVLFNHMGIDTGEVLAAARTKWNFLDFKPGFVGGHCIGVDPYYMIDAARRIQLDTPILKAAREQNEVMGHFAADQIINLMKKAGTDPQGASVAVLGVTFKENCRDLRNSKVFDLIHRLRCHGVKVVIHDPHADRDEVFKLTGIIPSFITLNTMSAVVVAAAHDEFKRLHPLQLREFCRDDVTPVLADIKSIYNADEVKRAGFDHVFKL